MPATVKTATGKVRRASQVAWEDRTREVRLAAMRSRHEEHRDADLARMRARGERLRGGPPRTPLTAEEKRADKRRRRDIYNAKLKSDVLGAYGGCCACCGDDYPPHLTLDHVRGGGSAERKAVGGGRNLYRRLRRLLPTLDPAYQVLCWNCNLAKAHLGACGCQGAKLRAVI